MAELELEAVLKFLRDCGLSESESALMEDVMENSQLGSSELEKFFFPMAPPPPLFRIPSYRRLPPPEELSGGGSSDDEFVSLGSSTTELCSSEFTNPYGFRRRFRASPTSSDGMTQFGTAQDYPDFYMQHDLFWYKEKDEDFAIPPLLEREDFSGDFREDEFVTAVQKGENVEDRTTYNFISVESIRKDNLKDENYKDYYELGDHLRLEQGILNETSANDNQSVATEERMKTSHPNFSVKQNSTYDLVGNFGDTHDFNAVKKDRLITRKVHETDVAVNEENDTFADKLHLCETQEDDFVAFDLRIIHRKNRLICRVQLYPFLIPFTGPGSKRTRSSLL